MNSSKYQLYDLDDKQGWILSSFMEENNIHYSPLLQFGRTNFCDPWKDPDFHYHTISQEIYLLIEGELWHIVNDVPILMKGRSILLVQPGVSHSIIGGKGKIQHFGMKIPHQDDEKIIDTKTRDLDDVYKLMKKGDIENRLVPSLGFVIDLNQKKNQNKWQLGIGHALYYTEEFCLAYVNFEQYEDQQTVDHKDIYHYHKLSTEWYLTLKGKQIFVIDNERLTVNENTLLRVNEGTPHKIISREFPFEGVTIRTPVIKGDKYVIEEK
jgi:mannose-6-phosphate isomerase-like protein (cupin superfamily)